MKDLTKLLKEVNKINLGKDDFLVMRFDEDTEASDIEVFKNTLDTFMDGKLKGRIILISGNVGITKIKKMVNGE